MLIKTVRSVLELHPAGLSNEQLLWRLRNVGLRFSVDDILHSLGALIETGEVAMTEPGRWRIVASRRVVPAPAAGAPTTQTSAGTTPAQCVLSAVTATIAKSQQQGEVASLSDAEGGVTTRFVQNRTLSWNSPMLGDDP
jgi:hypothetical protein